MSLYEKAFSNINSIRNARNDREVLSVLRSVATDAGFEHFIVSGLPHRGIKLEPFVLVSDWPKEWFDRYMSRSYVEVDPVARHCFRTLDPFDWNDAPLERDKNAPAQRLMDEATEFGLTEGVCIPVHTEDGMQGCVSFGGRKVDVDPETILSLHLVSLYAHGRLRLFRRRARFSNRPRLTDREAEILKWVASGKTSLDVSDLLGISKRTIDFHITNAGQKMGTVTRTQTVAEAVYYNLITL